MSVLIYFGVPGSGKSTLAAKIVYNNFKRHIKTYSNVPISGAYLINSSDIGKVDISDGDLILDEAAIDFNNRSYKTMPKSSIEWFKLHRHYGIGTIHVFSQSYEDMDITLRRLQTCMYRITRTMIPSVFMKRKIAVSIGIDKESHQIIEHYKWSGFPSFFCGLRYWSMFDSYAAPTLPASEFESVGFTAQMSFKAFRKHLRSVRFSSLRHKAVSFYVSLASRLMYKRLSR